MEFGNDNLSMFDGEGTVPSEYTASVENVLREERKFSTKVLFHLKNQ